MTDLTTMIEDRVKTCEGSVAAEFEDGILLLRLNVPTRLNAIDIKMLEALTSLLDLAVAQKEVRAVIITGSGRAFSSGQHLHEVRVDEQDRSKPAPSDLLRLWYNPLICNIRSADVPIIAAVNGIAAGGATNIALACDFVVAGRSATFVQGFTKIALMPDCGGTWLLPRLIGDARARAAMFLNEPIDAEAAERIGMIYACVDDGELLSAAKEIAREVATLPRRLVCNLKRLLRESSQHNLLAQLNMECEFQCQAESDPAYREGVTAFQERRKPKFL